MALAHSGRKQKGSKAERELIHMFWGSGWAAARMAGSGSTGFPSPDILAGNNLRKIAIECKSVGSSSKYFTKEEIDQLVKFSRNFGAEPWVAVKFSRREWYFIPIEDLKKTEKSFVADIGLAERRGLLFSDLVNG